MVSEFLLVAAGNVFVRTALQSIVGGLEGYTKDFFKDCVSDVVGLASEKRSHQALATALKQFLELVEDELLNADVPPATVRDLYQKDIQTLIHDDQIKPLLGKAFDPDCRAIDANSLAQRWAALNLQPMPEGFDWEQISKAYLRSVKKQVRESEDLRELLKLHNQEAIRRGVEELAGIPKDFDLRKYQESLRERYGNLKLESLDTNAYAYNELKLWKMFIPQDVRSCQEFNPKLYEIPKERLRQLMVQGDLDAAEMVAEAELADYRQRYGEQIQQGVLDVIGDTTLEGIHETPLDKLSVILGDPGSGKSTLFQYLALQWVQHPIRQVSDLKTRFLPLLIELRLYARNKQEGRCNTFLEFLHQGETACHLNQHRLHEVLQNGHALALFDGLDEVFDPQLREAITTEIHRFTNDYPAVQTLVTSRWLGYKAQTLRDAGFKHYMLQDLTEGQINDFIERWHNETFRDGAEKARKQERLRRAITESKAIRELAGNPLLLTMMAILNRKEELPRNRSRLYERASEVLLHQWDIEQKLLPDPRLKDVAIELVDKQAMLRNVAFHMQSGEKGLSGNIITRTDLEKILVKYLRDLEVPQPVKVARLMIEQLRSRNFILCFLGADSFAFVHRTFLESFCAWSFLQRFEKAQTLTFEELRDQTFGTHWRDESWHEVLRLISGMIDPKFVVEIVHFLMAQTINPQDFLNEGDRLKPEGIGHLLLAADCLQEVRSPSVTASITQTLIQHLQQQAKQEYPHRFNSDAAQSLMRAIATLGKDNSNTLEWLKQCVDLEPDSYLPESAVEAIALVWPHQPNTQTWLHQQVVHPNNQYVRRTAVSELARGWKD
ncbi:MAG: NACHT domain-containing protein, partial [Cyanobacteria bacterium J06638_22]